MLKIKKVVLIEVYDNDASAYKDVEELRIFDFEPTGEWYIDSDNLMYFKTNIDKWIYEKKVKVKKKTRKGITNKDRPREWKGIFIGWAYVGEKPKTRDIYVEETQESVGFRYYNEWVCETAVIDYYECEK